MVSEYIHVWMRYKCVTRVNHTHTHFLYLLVDITLPTTFFHVCISCRVYHSPSGVRVKHTGLSVVSLIVCGVSKSIYRTVRCITMHYTIVLSMGYLCKHSKSEYLFPTIYILITKYYH